MTKDKAQKERKADMALKMECAEEPLSAAQLSFKRNLQEQSDKVKGMIESIVNEYGGTLLCQAGMVSAYQYTLPTNAPQPGLKTTLPSTVTVNKASANNQTIKLNMVNSNAAQGNIQLVMDPRMGVILGTVAPQITNVPMVTTANSISSPTITTNTTRVIPAQKSAVTSRPSEQTSVGGINLGKNGDPADETNKNLPDSREVTFNKINGGRTYPSLVVVARPSLRSKNITSQVVQKERSDLDMKVKGILMFPATKFTEWLIQQGLVRSEQICRKHSYGNQQKKLKLGMYSDSGTFPLSGGYVWISSCCPDQYVSVFYNSIFQNAKYTPAILLKLIYHWACQTNVQNVISWVKVTNLYVKNFFATLRSVCTAVVWDKCKKMGGKNSMIQVGVISLGTTSQDGNLRQVKVEVLGVLDPETLDLRLRACEPIKDGDRSYKKRFNNILSPLAEWVSKDSKILTDFTVDKGTLYEMGFHNVIQSAFTDQNPRNLTSNYHIMEYLRKIVPRMFQNTLSLLSRPMIQQFLDELVWREMYGPTPLRAFDNIILHTAELTKLETDDVLIDRLAKIADNPFHNWSYTETSFPSIIEVLPKSKTSAPMVTIPGDSALHSRIEVGKSFSQSRFANAKKARKRVADSTEIVSNIPEKVIKDSRPEFYPLQEFYYATMEGNKTIFNKQLTVKFSFKCFLCTTIMHTNTEIMEHMISHVPPQVPGHTDSPVCRYCCTAFSSKHQMSVHITEAHSNFGHSDSDMLVCAICEQKFGTSNLLVNHMSSTHHPSEMPYRCNTCGYRTSSHKDVIDHFYKVHDKSEGLQCPYCLKVIKFIVCGRPNSSSAHSFLIHMQRHFTRREEVNNKCPRCCLWFNQRSLLKNHLNDLHREVSNARVVPYKNSGSAKINVSRFRQQVKRVVLDDNANYEHMFESIKRWPEGPIRVNLSDESYDCHECEEDIDIFDHYPGEQKCPNCTYVTCCWRAFNEHQKQIHNERPGMSVTVPSPLINIPLEKKMYCECDFKSNDGNLLASHLVKCDKTTAFASGGMLDCLGLQPKAMNDLF